MKKAMFLWMICVVFNMAGYSQEKGLEKEENMTARKRLETMAGGKLKPGFLSGYPKSFMATPHYDDILSKREIRQLAAERISLFKDRDLDIYTEQVIYDTSHFRLSVGLIDTDELSHYQVRVTKNNQVLLPWQSLDKFPYLSDDLRSDIGNYNLNPDDTLVADLRTGSDPAIVATLVCWWEDIQPKLLDVFSNSEFDDFIRLSKEFVVPDRDWQRDSANFFEKKLANRWSARYAANDIDAATHLPKKLVEPSTENSLIFYLDANIHNENIVEYSLLKDGKEYTAWKPNDNEFEYIWLKNLPPGDYVLKVRYRMQRNHVLEYPFEIQKAWQQTTAFKIVAGSLIAAFFGFIILLFRTRQQQREAIAATLKRTQLSLSLQSLQSQLNPHFVFNALTSIQGLVNSSRTGDANRYLSGFASLLRRSLEDTEELSPLENEIATLRTYLSLEQLRFGFRYTVSAENGINTSAIEFPRLLLQPLAENAVKHGVLQLKEKGMIAITFTPQEYDMIVTVTDNGSGFETEAARDGYGLTLTAERIRILNELMPEKPIAMDIRSGSNGTIITITCKRWLV